MRFRNVPGSEGIMLHPMASKEPDASAMGIDPTSPVARLSHGQIECLLLVDHHHNSKEIAAKLGISLHTVDQRIRGALEKLGVERRGEAAPRSPRSTCPTSIPPRSSAASRGRTPRACRR